MVVVVVVCLFVCLFILIYLFIYIPDNSLSNEMMAAELDIMKSIEAHQNICNLLAYCTVG